MPRKKNGQKPAVNPVDQSIDGHEKLMVEGELPEPSEDGQPAPRYQQGGGMEDTYVQMGGRQQFNTAKELLNMPITPEAFLGRSYISAREKALWEIIIDEWMYVTNGFNNPAMDMHRAFAMNVSVGGLAREQAKEIEIANKRMWKRMGMFGRAFGRMSGFGGQGGGGGAPGYSQMTEENE